MERQTTAAWQRQFHLYEEVDDEDLPAPARFFVVLKGAALGTPVNGVLACIGPLTDFSRTTEVAITCDAGTMATYSAAYAVVGQDDPRFYSLVLQQDIAEAWLALGVFPDAVAQPAQAVRDVIGLCALMYAALLDYGQQYIAPGQADPTALLNEIVWEGLRRLRQDGFVEFRTLADIAEFEITGRMDLETTVRENLDALYAHVTGLLGFSRFDAENIVRTGTIVQEETVPPDPPADLVAAPLVNGAAVRWRPDPRADGYRIFVDFVQVAEVRGAAYQVEGLTGNREYVIGVQAFNRYGESEVVTAAVRPAEPPAAVAIEAAFDEATQTVTVTWEEGSTTIEGARISYRLTRNGRVIFEGRSTRYVDTAITPGATYTYTVVVVATDAQGNEFLSEPATAQVIIPEPEEEGDASPSAPRNVTAAAQIIIPTSS